MDLRASQKDILAQATVSRGNIKHTNKSLDWRCWVNGDAISW
jgi:hypothetical protein